MKPNFALNITESGLSLLHRTPRGWLEVGTANFDAPDLDEALGYLRASALGLSPHGITTKLILPPDQILYTEVEAPGPDKATREKQIRAALEGLTPYAVEDLVFDWWGTGPKVKVAVVARETLDEAEGFATTHRFNPVSFVTTPAEGQFAGEPWFGVTKLSASVLPAGEKVARDQDPINVIARDAPKAAATVKQDTNNEDTAKVDEDATDAVDGKANASSKSATADKADAKAEAAAKAEQDAKAAAEADAKTEAQKAEKLAAEKLAADTKADQEAKAKQDAEAAQKAKDDEQERLDAEAAADAEALRKIEAAKAEMERRAQELAQAEAKRLVEEAEKAKAAQLEREKTKAALIEAERKRADLERVAAEAAAAKAEAFNGVTDQNIADGKGSKANAPQPEAAKAYGIPAFTSRRADATSAAPTLGPASAKDSAKEPAATSRPELGKADPSTDKSKSPAAPSARPVSGSKPASTLAAAIAKSSAPKPLNGTAAFATGAKAELAKPKQDEASVAANVAAAKVTAARIPGAGAALARFKSKTQKKALAKSGQATATKPVLPKSGGRADSANTMGAFGAKMAPRRGKPRFLGLILTLVLIAVLAGIAAWSSLYLSRDTGTPETVQQADAGATTAAAPTTDEVAMTQGTAPDGVATETAPEVNAEIQADAEAELPPIEEVTATAQSDTQPPAAEMIAGSEPAEKAPTLAETEGQAQAEGPGRGPQDEIFLAAIDQAQPSFDAIALPLPISKPDSAPTQVSAPPPFGTQYEFEPDGTIKATANGVVMPEGFWLIAAKPPVLPPARPAAISSPVSTAPDLVTAAPPPPDTPGGAAVDPANASTAGVAQTEGTGPSSVFQADANVNNTRPKGKPAMPDAAAAPSPDDGAALASEDPALARLTSLRPLARPKAVLIAAEEASKAVETASLAAKAAAQEQAAQDGALTVALSPRPAARPRDFSGAVEAAIAAASRESTRQVVAPEAIVEPEQADEPEVTVASAPRIPTHANVAQQATFKNAINLSKTNLIGVYGSDSKRYALIRTASGKYSKVRVGDRLDGGTVAAITNNEVRYKKGSRMLSLSMPNG